MRLRFTRMVYRGAKLLNLVVAEPQVYVVDVYDTGVYF